MAKPTVSHMSKFLTLKTPNPDSRGHQCGIKRKVHLSPPPCSICLLQSRTPFTTLAGEVHTLLVCSICCPPGPPSPFLPSCSQAGRRPSRPGAGAVLPQVQDFASLLAELHGAPVRPFFPACQDLSGQQHDPVMYQPLLPVLCQQQNC